MTAAGEGAPLLDAPAAAHDTQYSSRIAFALGINYIIGTGVFSLPYGFYESGLVLGVICTLVGGFFSLSCVNWMFEGLARSEGSFGNAEAPTGDRLLTAPYVESGWASPAGKPPHQAHTQHGGTHRWPPINELAQHRCFDLSAMYSMWFGIKGMVVSQLVMSFYTYAILWAYGAVFASTVASLFFQFAFSEECNIYQNPGHACNNAYYICICIYAAIVIPMSCLDLGEQAKVQISLTIYRFSAFFVMLGTVFAAMASGSEYRQASGGDMLGRVSPELPNFSFFKPSGFGTMFTSAIVALCMHYALGSVVQPIADKRNAQKAIMGSMSVSIFFYILIGLTCAVYFGPYSEPLVVLNWTDFTGKGGGWGPLDPGEKRVWWSILIQLWVMLFPVLDMLSVFPLVCIPLSQSLQSVTPVCLSRLYPTKGIGAKLVRIAYRLCGAIPPIVLATGVRQLNVILQFTGIASFVLNFFLPCILALHSSRMQARQWGPDSVKTPYTLPFISSQPFQWGSLVYGVLALAFCILVLADPGVL